MTGWNWSELAYVRAVLDMRILNAFMLSYLAGLARAMGQLLNTDAGLGSSIQVKAKASQALWAGWMASISSGEVFPVCHVMVCYTIFKQTLYSYAARRV
eukprot:scaffold2390_cov280-Prasinococcus_capsulatus_cf.AAC.9